jgi:hypothetical protein
MDHGVQLQRQARDAREGILGGEAWRIADHHVLSADHQRVAEPQMQPPDRRKANPKQPSQGAVLGHPSRPGVPSAPSAREARHARPGSSGVPRVWQPARGGQGSRMRNYGLSRSKAAKTGRRHRRSKDHAFYSRE